MSRQLAGWLAGLLAGSLSGFTPESVTNLSRSSIQTRPRSHVKMIEPEDLSIRSTMSGISTALVTTRRVHPTAPVSVRAEAKLRRGSIVSQLCVEVIPGDIIGPHLHPRQGAPHDGGDDGGNGQGPQGPDGDQPGGSNAPGDPPRGSRDEPDSDQDQGYEDQVGQAELHISTFAHIPPGLLVEGVDGLIHTAPVADQEEEVANNVEKEKVANTDAGTSVGPSLAASLWENIGMLAGRGRGQGSQGELSSGAESLELDPETMKLVEERVEQELEQQLALEDQLEDLPEPVPSRKNWAGRGRPLQTVKRARCAGPVSYRQSTPLYRGGCRRNHHSGLRCRCYRPHVSLATPGEVDSGCGLSDLTLSPILSPVKDGENIRTIESSDEEEDRDHGENK